MNKISFRIAQAVEKVPIKDWLGGLTADNIIQRVINTLLMLIGVVALLGLIYSGYLYVSSGGNPEKAQAAKMAAQYSLSGLIISFAAYAIINFIISNIF